MNWQEILDSVLSFAEAILPLAGEAEYSALIGLLQPHIDSLIAKITARLEETQAWTPDEQAAFLARIAAIQTDPAWVVTP